MNKILKIILTFAKKIKSNLLNDNTNNIPSLEENNLVIIKDKKTYLNNKKIFKNPIWNIENRMFVLGLSDLEINDIKIINGKETKVIRYYWEKNRVKLIEDKLTLKKIEITQEKEINLLKDRITKVEKKVFNVSKFKNLIEQSTLNLQGHLMDIPKSINYNSNNVLIYNDTINKIDINNDTFDIFSDGSYAKTELYKYVGSGVSIQNNKGCILFEASTEFTENSFSFEYNSLDFELLSISNSLTIAKELGFKKIRLFSDGLVAIQEVIKHNEGFTKKEMLPTKLNLLNYISTQLNNFDEKGLMFIPREYNKRADYLSKIRHKVKKFKAINQFNNKITTNVVTVEINDNAIINNNVNQDNLLEDVMSKNTINIETNEVVKNSNLLSEKINKKRNLQDFPKLLFKFGDNIDEKNIKNNLLKF